MIHEIVYHGNGGYDYYTVYNMPNWLRKYTWKEINDFILERNKAQKAASEKGKNKKSLVDSDGKVNVPDFKSASAPYKGKTSYK